MNRISSVFGFNTKGNSMFGKTANSVFWLLLKLTRSYWYVLFFTGLCVWWAFEAAENGNTISASIQFFFLGGWIGAICNNTIAMAWKGMYKSQRRMLRIQQKWHDKHIALINKIHESEYIECPKCHRKSFNTNDIINQFCGHCGFHHDLIESKK